MAPSARLASVLLLTSSLSAQGWLPCEALTPISPRTGHALVPLPNGDLMLFGGDSATPTATDWVWDGVHWRPLTTGVPRREGAAVAAFGPGRVLVFGGSDSSGSRTDTWRSDNGTVWTSVVSPQGPGVLTEMSMVGVPGEDRAVLIGRRAGTTWETWFYDVANGWTVGPLLAAQTATLVVDTVRGDVQVFFALAPILWVWRLEGSQWQPLVTLPSGPTIDEIAFDGRRGRSVLLQRFDDRAVAEFDGLSIVSSQPGSGAPVATNRTAMAFHARRDEVVLVTNDAGVMATWRLATAPEPATYPFGSSCSGPAIDLYVPSSDVPMPGLVHRLAFSAPSASYVYWLLVGVSTLDFGGSPLPLAIPVGAGACELLIDPLVYFPFSIGGLTPSTVGISVPPTPTLAGARYVAQVVQLNGANVLATSKGLQVQIGLPSPELELRESFDDELNRDIASSGDRWLGGACVPTRIGGDGRHGSFQVTFGQSVGDGVYVWSTDNQTIPASATMSGQDEVVTDGRFYFSDLVVPYNTRVRFVGNAPVQLFVRGRVEIFGTIDVSGDDLPTVFGQATTAYGPQTAFDARGVGSQVVQGQEGTSGGPGGGRGGRGGKECEGNGVETAVVDGVTVFLNDGQAGEGVQLQAGHAYAAQAASTGGAGSPMAPSDGLNATALTEVLPVWRASYSRGGGGGGFALPGTAAFEAQDFFGSLVLFNSPAVPPAAAFPLLPLPSPAPAGFSSLNHFLVGGSGGGGGGSHTFSLPVGSAATPVGERFMAGHGGTGGGGAIAIRSGGRLTVDSGSRIDARGGGGVRIYGDDPITTPTVRDLLYGLSSPGGGGSGGSVLLQSSSLVIPFGTIDVAGSQGSGSEGTLSPPGMYLVANAGSGSPGFLRIEQPSGTVSRLGTQVVYDAGAFTDSDARTGSRSIWLRPTGFVLPIYLRYELLVRINGLPILYSDDPSVSPLAAGDQAGPVHLRFQGARFMPNGAVDPDSIGPWRGSLGAGTASLNRDYATAVRFDLVVDKTQGVVEVLDLRIVYR